MTLRKLFFRLLVAGVVLVACAVLWLLSEMQRFNGAPMNVQTQQHLLVKPGTSLWGVANQLKRMSVIEQPRYLVWWAQWHDLDQRIQAGEYLLAPGITPQQLLEQLAKGEVVQHTLTIVEGWSVKQMLEAMHAHPKLTHTLKDVTLGDILDRLDRPAGHPEGMFMPDTYHFPAGTTDVEFLQRAYDAMAHLLEAEWVKREQGLPLKSAYEALILASIVEKETGLEEERQEIAGVFVRRLQSRMRLQTDPTVIYGIGDAYDGNIRRRDLRRDTPYNTYTRHGLTPTPIALPGADSIHAALHPAKGDSLYFVATGGGGHYFSSTLEEHNRAVQKYQIAPFRKRATNK